MRTAVARSSKLAWHQLTLACAIYLLTRLPTFAGKAHFGPKAPLHNHGEDHDARQLTARPVVTCSMKAFCWFSVVWSLDVLALCCPLPLSSTLCVAT